MTINWELLGNLFWGFAYLAYLCAIVVVLGDLFRDHRLSGWAKAAWLVFLIFVPFLTVLVYVIVRGRGLVQRDQRSVLTEQVEADETVSSNYRGSTRPVV